MNFRENGNKKRFDLEKVAGSKWSIQNLGTQLFLKIQLPDVVESDLLMHARRILYYQFKKIAFLPPDRQVAVLAEKNSSLQQHDVSGRNPASEKSAEN